MRRKKSSSNASSRAAHRPPAASTRRPKRRALGFVRWVLGTARPRTAAEFVTLVLVLLSVATFLSAGVAAARGGQTPWPALLWCCALLAGALASRLWPWWRAQVQAMTSERLRGFLGSALLVYVALSLSWHVLVVNLRLGDGFLLPSPLGRLPQAILTLVLLGSLGVAILCDLPVTAWARAAARAGLGRLDQARSRRLVESVRVENLPPAPPEPLPEQPASQVRPRSDKTAQTVSLPEGESTSALTPPKNGSILPPLDIFIPAPRGTATPIDLEHTAQRIQETLRSFNVGARVVGHHCGPVVTQFDLQPDRGVKVRRITELQNDLALALAAPTIRIQAPVPGKPVVGIEIPNTAASRVAVRELLESEAYRSVQSPLKVALGKDVAGNPTIIDLARLPHLLIAGATGSGKSVCVNAMISCLLYQSRPDQVRLMMVDPKMVELSVYNGVPHLLSPVITQMDKVIGVLEWAVREMQRRYQIFTENTVRNIQHYHQKVQGSGLSNLPYIVLIVDELADLMMVSPEEVEDAICRLAQLGRAAGIHLVIATQRPSVDVITGLIKANFPARIAFAMTSQVDSRTILDTVGAEKLLGRGDMLYLPSDAPKAIRLQGAYLSDQEIERLVEFWRRSPLRSSVEEVSQEDFVAARKAAEGREDDLLHEATRVVCEYQHASVSLLQRRLKIGYARASRLMDQLEARGIVGAADGSKQRPVLGEPG